MKKIFLLLILMSPSMAHAWSATITKTNGWWYYTANGFNKLEINDYNIRLYYTENELRMLPIPRTNRTLTDMQIHVEFRPGFGVAVFRFYTPDNSNYLNTADIPDGAVITLENPAPVEYTPSPAPVQKKEPRESKGGNGPGENR
jgi:hypothetical protein